MVGPYYAASCVLPSGLWDGEFFLHCCSSLVWFMRRATILCLRRSPRTSGLSSARLDRLAQALRGDIDHGRMPGAVIAITRKGKLAYYESFGFLDTVAGTPMPKDAIAD